ncbi:MAG: alpha/beta hydrolase [Alphaproteobacteria bacterium]|nr:alpha/beta hydrolase [Alphaproteobacteria bacterium]
MKIAVIVGLSLVCLYIFVILFFWIFQNKFMFCPKTRLITGHQDELFDYQEVSLRTGDKLNLQAYYHAPEDNEKPVIIFFHGNTGTAFDSMHKMIPLVNAGYGILMPEYRGYGKNKGEPSEQGFLLDGMAAVSFVRDQMGEKAKIIYFGHSMGTGVANMLAEEIPPAGLILEGGFTSMTDAAKSAYPFLPIKLFIKNKFNSIKMISKLTAPLLILHGEQDKTIPFAQALEMQNAAIHSTNKTLKSYPTGHHNDLYDLNYGNDIVAWLKETYK